MRPQSCTATSLSTCTMPVSVSTLTSAICAPPTPLEMRSSFPRWRWPTPVMGDVPSFAQACFHEMALLGLPLTRISPSTASSSSGFTEREGATFSRSWLSAAVAARRVEELTPPTVVEPPDAPSAGYFESPMFTFTASNGNPIVSAAMMPMTVRVPVPRSCEPSETETEPSG